MRRLRPAVCPSEVEEALAGYQSQVDAGDLGVNDAWTKFSRSRTFDDLRSALCGPLGLRRRCAYCSDSRAADVEHYWPKTKFPARAFLFENLLFVCPECNRKKTSSFPTDDEGFPLLINPTFDDPWDSMFFVPATGMVDARIISVDKDGVVGWDPHGVATLNVFGEILNSDPVLAGRVDSWRKLTAALRTTLESTDPLPSSQLEIFGDDDLYGLGEFMLNREGKNDREVRAIREGSVDRWITVRELPRFP